MKYAIASYVDFKAIKETLLPGKKVRSAVLRRQTTAAKRNRPVLQKIGHTYVRLKIDPFLWRL